MMASLLVSYILHKVFSRASCFTKHRPRYGCLQPTSGKQDHAARLRWMSSAAGFKGQPSSPEQMPSEADVLVIGGGIVGTSLAYFLGSLYAARRTPGQPPLRVIVMQGDLSFKLLLIL